jgi:pilus assembly protein CpaE
LSAPEPRILVLDRTGELASRIRHNAVAPGAVVKACPDAGRAETMLGAAPWDVIVAGPSVMHRAGLRRLGSIHQRFPWVSIVLALHERPRADLAEIIQVGADDLVPLHADDAELKRTLARATRISRGRLGAAAPGGRAGRGRIVMMSSASGGCGKTFLATNAAEFLFRTTGEPVVLLDLDLQFGEVSTALRLRPDVTITDALTAEAEGHDLDEILDEYLLTHPDGFKVLAAPRLPGEADSVTPGDIARILDVLRARRAWVVIDTHEGLGDLFGAALEATDHVFVVATPDRPSLVNLGRYLVAMERLGMAAGNISVVLNKAESDVGLDAVEMEAELGRPFAAVLPYSRDVPRSINVGVPLIVNKPKAPISTQLTAALSAVLPRSRPRRPESTPVMPVTVRLPAPVPVPVPIAVPAPAPAPAPAEPVPVPAATAPEPPPAVADTPVAARPAPPAPFDVHLSRSRLRPCRVAVPARQGGRGRRSCERLVGGPCRGRGPPVGSRRLHRSHGGRKHRGDAFRPPCFGHFAPGTSQATTFK